MVAGKAKGREIYKKFFNLSPSPLAISHSQDLKCGIWANIAAQIASKALRIRANRRACKSNFPQNLYTKIPKRCARSCTTFGSQTSGSSGTGTLTHIQWERSNDPFLKHSDDLKHEFCWWRSFFIKIMKF